MKEIDVHEDGNGEHRLALKDMRLKQVVDKEINIQRLEENNIMLMDPSGVDE